MCSSCLFLDELVWDSVCRPSCVSPLPITQKQGVGRVFQIFFLNPFSCLQEKPPVHRVAHSLSNRILRRKTCVSPLRECPPLAIESYASFRGSLLHSAPWRSLYDSGNLTSLGPKHCPLREAQCRGVKEADSQGHTAAPKASFRYSQPERPLPGASSVPPFPSGEDETSMSRTRS